MALQKTVTNYLMPGFLQFASYGTAPEASVGQECSCLHADCLNKTNFIGAALGYFQILMFIHISAFPSRTQGNIEKGRGQDG